jgi:autotransporter-associated beta strand protein
MKYTTLNTIRPLLALCLLPVAAGAADYQWNASSYSDWVDGTTSNWLVDGSQPATSPGAGDNVITPAQNGTMGLKGSYTINNFNVVLAGGTPYWNIYAGNGGARALTVNNMTLDGGGYLFMRGNIDATMALYASSVNIANGTLALGSVNNNNVHEFIVSGLTTIDSSNSNINLYTDTTSFNGGVNMNGGNLNIYTGTGTNLGTVSASFLTGSSGVVRVYNVNNSASATLTINGTSGTHDYSGLISDGGNNTLSLIKSGASTQSLSSANTYSGGTLINGGMLLVANTTGSATGTGSVTVNVGGILAGGGIIAPSAGENVAVNGTLSPGSDGADTIAFDLSGDSKLSFGSGSQVALNLGTVSDMISFTSSGDWLEGSGNVTLMLSLDAGFDYENTYTIFQNVTTTGFELSNVTGFDDSNYQYNFELVGGNYVLSFQPIPEPSSMALGGVTLLTGCMLRMRKRYRR